MTTHPRSHEPSAEEVERRGVKKLSPKQRAALRKRREARSKVNKARMMDLLANHETACNYRGRRGQAEIIRQGLSSSIPFYVYDQLLLLLVERASTNPTLIYPRTRKTMHEAAKALRAELKEQARIARHYRNR